MRAYLHTDRGSGPALLYVPGIDGTGDLMLGTASRLEQEFRLLRLKYRAEGERGADTYEALAASIAGVCKEQGVERCVVVAESFGGAVALQLALDFPDLVSGLMVVNSFAHFPGTWRLRVSELLSGFVPRWLFELGRKTFVPLSLFGARSEKALVEEFRALPGAFFDEAYMRRMAMIRGLDLRPRLGELRQPTMLFASDGDRIVPALVTMAIIEAAVPQATLTLVKGGGHLILPLAEEPWVERVQELLGRISEST
jgi:aminoacrylate hydrolase